MATKAKLPSTAVGRRRLLKGATLLEADAKDKSGIKFDFSQVGFVYDRAKPVSCGTVGCALGLFGVSGAFKKEWLSYQLSQAGYIYLSFESRQKDTFGAASRFFQITQSQANYLFASDDGLPKTLTGARAERAVAKRIRQFVAGKVAA